MTRSRDTRIFQRGMRVEVTDKDAAVYFGMCGTVVRVSELHGVPAIVIDMDGGSDFSKDVTLFSYKLTILPMSIQEQVAMRLIYGV
jgi:hypothetical protein